MRRAHWQPESERYWSGLAKRESGCTPQVNPAVPVPRKRAATADLVEKAGVLSELKKRQHYEKPSVQEKKKKAAAKKRLVKKMRKSRIDG